MTENGVVEQPRDLSEATFELAGTKDGADWLEVTLGNERIFLPHNAQSPDVGIYHFGRGDVQFPAAKTNVAFDISGLSAWQNGDRLQIVSPNVGLALAAPENGFSIYPSVGSTTISGQAIDWKTAFAPIIDPAKGDTTWVVQMVGATSDSKSHYSTLARAGIARGFTVSDGRSGTLSAALAPVAQDRGFTLRWKGSAFAALAAQVGPGAQPAGAPAIAVHALPDQLARNNNFYSNVYAGLPSLVDFGPLPGSADFEQAIRYGNPFASNGARWTELVTVVYAMPVPVPTPHGVGSLSAMVVAAIPVSSLAGSAAITPPISPVRNAKINGEPLDAVRTGIGTSPTLTWDAPAIGASTSYAVTVHAIDASNDGVSTKKLGTFHTKSASLELPASVMAAGGSYAFTITSISSQGADLTSKPFIGSLPYASADYVTARVTP